MGPFPCRMSRRAGFPDNVYIHSARTDDADVLTDGLDVTDHSVDSLVVIVGSKGGTVEGNVYGERQEPIVGAHAVLMPNSSRRATKVVTTDQSGRFAIRGIVPGDYKIFAWDDVEPNAYFDPSFIEPYDAQGTPLHVETSGHVTAKSQGDSHFLINARYNLTRSGRRRLGDR